MIIREETEEDFRAIGELNREAFGGDYESKLIENLRADGQIVLSLVAADRGGVIAHVLFSRLSVEINGRPIKAVALAPLAVSPARQRQGIGSLLVKEGLDRLARKDEEVVLVLGHPEY